MPVMVDTNLLVYALEGIGGRITPEIAASLNVLRNADSIALSTMTWLEVHLHIRPLQRAALHKLARHPRYWQILEMDTRVAERAAELLTLRSRDIAVCPICLCVRKAAPCKACKRNISRPQRFSDAVIVATAECANEIDVLYSFDAGVIDLGRMITNCDVIRPSTPELRQVEVSADT